MAAITGNEMIHGEQATKQVVAEVPRKKVSWFGTIMWMLGMIVLFNIVAGIVVYVAWHLMH